MTAKTLQFDSMFEVFRRNFEAGRLAHAFVVQGAPGGEGLTFAREAIQLLYCEGLTKPCGECAECRKVTDRNHPDVKWLEPEKRSRTFDVDKQIRPMLRDFAQTSYQGGWKVVVLVEADRLNDSQANAILKALEEPGQRRLWLLLTAQPDQLLTTIHSRCQRIVLSHGQASFSGTWIEPLREMLQVPPPAPGIPAIVSAAYLKGILETEKAAITKRVRAELGDEEVSKEVFEARVRSEEIKTRLEILRYMTLWKRDVLACACGGESAALNFQDDETTLRSLAKVSGVPGSLSGLKQMQDVARRFDRNMPEQQVFEAAMMGG